MKKLIESNNFLVIKITYFLILICIGFTSIGQQSNQQRDTTYMKDIKFTKKMMEQSKRVERLDSVADSINIKWDLIEQKIKERREH